MKRIKMDRTKLKTVLLEQSQAFRQKDRGIEREQLAVLKKTLNSPQTIVISGVRRAGKSTLLCQLADYIGMEKIYYVNFEDERFLDFHISEADMLWETLIELFGERKIFLLDEIQNIEGWERFVRRFMDLGQKFYITGSNASLLSKELGTKLTGRHLSVELFPFSFREYIAFKGEEKTIEFGTSIKKARLKKLFNDYLYSGGIPEALKYPELPLLQSLYDNIIYRDVVARYKIEAVKALKELSIYLMTNIANPISFNKLKNLLKLGSVNTVKDYCEYLEQSWLINIVNTYSYSLKKQQIAAKKIYSIDTGLAKTVSFSFSENSGKLLENLVYLFLRRGSNNIYYYQTQTGKEVDFYLPKERKLIQVCHNINNANTRERETEALKEAMAELKIKTGLILSDYETPFEDKTIEIMPVDKWLLL